MARWQCRYCGATISSTGRPGNKTTGKCPDTSSGNHIWDEM